MSTRIRGIAGLPALLHALFFIAAATQTAIVPLLPRLDSTYGLSPAASALLLAAPGLATLAVSLPAGLLADRLGARRMTVVASALMCLAGLAQATPSYPVLLIGRLAFGLAFGIVWTTGVAWMARAGDGENTPHLGAVSTSAAVGMVAGPALGGALADAWGVGAPFLILGSLTALLTAALWRQPGARGVVAAPTRGSLMALARLAPRRPGVVAGALALAIGGGASGVAQLLVPLQLHAAGFSAAATGGAFSAAAGLYIVVSAIVVRLGARAVTLRVAALAALLLAVALLPASLDAQALVIIGALIVSTGSRAVVSTVAYPLATEAAAAGVGPLVHDEDTGAPSPVALGDGAVIGLLNGTWALGIVVTPLIAGALDQSAGAGVAYLSAVVPGALAAMWLLRRRDAHPVMRAAASVQTGA